MPRKKTTVSNNKKIVQKQNSRKRIREDIIAIVLFTLAVFFYLALKQYQGLPQDNEIIGIIGIYLILFLETIFGQATLLVPIFLLLWAIHIAVFKRYWSIRMWGITLLIMSILISKSIYSIPGGLNPLEAGMKGLGGGYLGGIIAFVLNKLLGYIGSLILLSLTYILAILLIFEKTISEIYHLILMILKKIWSKISDFSFYESDESDESEVSQEIIKPTISKRSNEALIIDNLNKETVQSNEMNFSSIIDIKEIPQEIAILKENKTSENLIKKKAEGTFSDYKKPNIEILTLFKNEKSIDKKDIKSSIKILEDTLSSFGINVKVNQVSCGPTITRYELTPAPGVKVSKIVSLADDLQLNMATAGIRIEAPIPGKSAIGIEVPNSRTSSVGLRSIISSASFKNLNTPLAFALGEDISGNSVVANLANMPHLLIAGSTGSGKSVCLNSIIMSFLYNTSPDELKLVLIDPKMVELTIFNGVPHLMVPVVTDAKKSSLVLRWMVTQMEKRYRLFSEKGVRDIYRYNQIAEEFLPFIVIVIDELADLMMVSPVEVEDTICRLAQMARAAGIHMIVATQRPSVDVITGLIKANIPSRIAFAVSSNGDSRTILDMAGAEKLLGKGDMLFYPLGAIKPFRVQGSYVSDAEIEKTMEFITAQLPTENKTEENTEIETRLNDMEEEKDIEDDLFWEAVSIFIDNEKASASLLQRKLKIGYARAARLVDLMEDKGIVSELEGNKRDILISREQFKKLYDKTNIC